MNEFIIHSGAKIAIQGASNNRYIRREPNDRLSCSGCHPFLHTDRESKARATFTIILVDDEHGASGRELAFGMNVFLKTEDGLYLISNPSGEVFVERPETRIDAQNEAVEKNLMKFRRWTLINRNNLISKKIIVTTNEVLLKSAFGNYLKAEGTELTTNSTLIEDKTTFFFQKSEVLPMPTWAILRPYQSDLYLSSQCADIFEDNETFFAQLRHSGTKLNAPIKFESPAAAQRHVLEETLYCLLSGDGQFIQRRFNQNHSSYYVFEYSEEFDVSFVQMIKKILPLAALHDKIKLFEELYGGINKGLILQAFCDGLAEIRKEFYTVVNSAEAELGRDELDAAKLWFYLQSSFKNFSAIERLLNDITQLKEGTILTLLYSNVTTAFDK
jgi:hypothetical protein